MFASVFFLVVASIIVGRLVDKETDALQIRTLWETDVQLASQ